MASVASKDARTALQDLLRRLRADVLGQGLEMRRLPAWVKAARVRFGTINDSVVAVFEDAPDGDSYESMGYVGADTVVLLRRPNFQPKGASLKARPSTGLVVLQGAVGKEGVTTMKLVSEDPAFFDVGYSGYHGPIGLVNVFFEHAPTAQPDGTPTALRFVPLALYVHARDIAAPSQTWARCREQMLGILTNIHGSAAGDHYEQRERRLTAFALSKETGVVVLGKDTGAHLDELVEVRDFLRSMGYAAELIKDLPEIPAMSNEEKVRLWCLSSRFSIMVDRTPAGHIAEYLALRNDRCILALVRPAGSGSTYMVGDSHLVDVNFVRNFETKSSALEVIGEAIEWAEGRVAARAAAYNQAYPWRQGERRPDGDPSQ